MWLERVEVGEDNGISWTVSSRQASQNCCFTLSFLSSNQPRSTRKRTSFSLNVILESDIGDRKGKFNWSSLLPSTTSWEVEFSPH